MEELIKEWQPIISVGIAILYNTSYVGKPYHLILNP